MLERTRYMHSTVKIHLHLAEVADVNVVLYCIVLYLSISIALLTASALQKRSEPHQLTLCRSSHTEALQATASEGLAQGPYVETRAGFEPTTIRSKGIDSTNSPPRPTMPVEWTRYVFTTMFCYNALSS